MALHDFYERLYSEAHLFETVALHTASRVANSVSPTTFFCEVIESFSHNFPYEDINVLFLLQKKKLSDMLGPQWSKEDLERFYEAYRKHGKDWRKV